MKWRKEGAQGGSLRHWVLIPAAAGIVMLSCCSGASAEIIEKKFRSRNVGDSFRVCMSLPASYAKGTKRYPVLVLLDGDLYFRETSEVFASMMEEGTLREFIIVGIGYPDTYLKRKRDYTPTRVHGFPTAGGVRKFYSFIRAELLPYVDKNYRTLPEGRCIAGHSLGGLAALYGLVRHGDLFDSYIVISPALWWDNELLFRYRPAKRASRGGIAPCYAVYAAAGSLEDIMMERHVKRYNRLIMRHWPDSRVGFAEFKDRDHYTVVPDALREGVLFVWGSGAGEAEPAPSACEGMEHAIQR
jgi:uncharacterized protein